MARKSPNLKDEDFETFIWNPRSLSFWKIKVNAQDIEWIESITKRFDIYRETKLMNSEGDNND